jgi:hypothetical protein
MPPSTMPALCHQQQPKCGMQKHPLSFQFVAKHTPDFPWLLLAIPACCRSLCIPWFATTVSTQRCLFLATCGYTTLHKDPIQAASGYVLKPGGLAVIQSMPGVLPGSTYPGRVPDMDITTSTMAPTQLSYITWYLQVPRSCMATTLGQATAAGPYKTLLRTRRHLTALQS